MIQRKKEKIILGEGTRIFIAWDDLLYITSANAKRTINGNNKILIYTIMANKVYMMYGSLNSIEERLPKFFIRFNSSTIVNLKKVNSFINFPTVCRINGMTFEIKDTYKKTATKKIEAFLMNNNDEKS